MDPPNAQLGECVELLERAFFESSVGNVSSSKKACLAAIRVLNGLLEDPSSKHHIRSLLAYSLALYDKIAASGASHLTFSERLLWIGSKVHQRLFPPVLLFAENLDSMNLGPFSNAANIAFPERINASYSSVLVENWTSERAVLATLFQDLLSNCSFVSAFLSIVASGNEASLIGLVSPHSPAETYKVSLYFNGCKRVVLANNHLPMVANSGRNLVIRSTAQENLLWPAIVEKAFLTIMGNGYDFKGSNMAADIFVLTEWIPEIIVLKSGTLPENMAQLWDLHSKGKITLGVGTGPLSKELSQNLNMITDHDYVVDNYDPYERKLHIKNPWAQQGNIDDRIVQLHETKLVHVSYFYINWDPSHLFKYTSKVHFVNLGSEDRTRLYEKPQFALENTTSLAQEVWLLLEKHLPIKDDLRTHIKVYQTTCGEKVLVPAQYTHLNTADANSNTRLQLLKCTLEPESAYTAVIVSSSNGAFTLSSYNNIGASFGASKAKEKHPNKLGTIAGEWKGASLGGNWLLASYIQNPQYDVEIRRQTTDLDLALFSAPERPVNIHLFYADEADTGVPIRNFDKSKLVFSNDYTSGFHHHSVSNLQPGHYKMVLSCFDTETAAKFDLIGLFSGPKDAISVNPIDTALGLFLRRKSVLWDNCNRIKVPFTTQYFNSALRFHILHENSHFLGSLESYRPAIRGSVFDENTALPIQINELWNDSIYGIFLNCTIAQPTRCVLLIERLEPGMGSCTVAIGGATSFTMG